ncbi:MAG: IS1595 family transposase [Desulfobaccales bacterium]
MDKHPSIFEILKKFDSEEKCIQHFEHIRWPHGLTCIRCGSKRIFQYNTVGKTKKMRHLYQCVDCKYNFSVTTGTVFHDSHLPLTKWFLGIYLICSAKKGVSAKQLQRQLSVSYKTAWYMAHRIRLAMSEDEDFCQKFAGICEVDETYVGGKGKGPRGRGAANKIPVVAIKERTSGKIRMKAVNNVKASTLRGSIRNHVLPGAEIHTDEFKSYLWLDSSEFVHNAVNHSETYVKAGNIHTNGIENVWSLFKRAITSVYHKVSAKYLPLYLNEFAYRFNHRDQVCLLDKVLETSF